MYHVQTANPDLVPDEVIVDIARYVATYDVESREAYDTAHLCFFDSIGCALQALLLPDCARHLGPIIPGATAPGGSRVPGTGYILDPVKAAFDIGALIRWLDFNDTWLAAEWGHPSDNLGAILAVCDYVSQAKIANGEPPMTMRDVFTAMIKAHEIQGVLALANSFNRVGLDHVLLVRIASAAVATWLLGGSEAHILNAVSQAFIDGGALRTYRHAPNTGDRKSWAAGDATSRAVRLAMMTMAGEMGYPTALSAPTWGFYDVLFKGKAFELPRPYGSYVMEHVLFKVSFPAEFHAQTAVEAAILLHPEVKDRLESIEKIIITTHQSAIRIIDKAGRLSNRADRDHCLQYMTAVGLIKGALRAEDYEDAAAADPRIDQLRERMVVVEDKQYSADYLDPDKRSIANAVRVFFEDGSATRNVDVHYPLGHRRRRLEARPFLEAKFASALEPFIGELDVPTIRQVFMDGARLDSLSVPAVMDMLATRQPVRSHTA